MKKNRILVSLLLCLTMLLPVLLCTAEAADGRTVVKVMGMLYRDGTDRELTDIEDAESYQLFDSWLAEKGIKVEFEAIANEQYDTIVNTRLANAQDLPDLMKVNLTDADAITYGENGVFVDVLEAIKKYDEDGSILAYWAKYMPNVLGLLTTDSGAMYWAPYVARVGFYDDVEGVYAGSNFLISVRKDWMEKLGLEYKLEMTLDELYEVIKAFQDGDANGNGLKDEVVGVDISKWDNGFAQAYGLPSKLATVVVGETEVACPWYSEGFKDYVAFMQKMINEGYYDTSVIGNSSVLNTMIAENKIGVLYSYAAQGWLDPTVTAEAALYAPVVVKTDYPFIMVDEGHSEMPTVTDKFVIPSTCKDVEAVVKLLDTVYTYDFGVLFQYGIEGKGYKVDENGHFYDALSYGTYGPDKSVTYVPFAWLTYAIPGNVLSFNTIEGTYTGAKAQEKYDGQRWAMEHPEAYRRIDSTQELAIANTAEVEKLAEIESALKTYSTETITQLILGNYSMDDLDTYVEEMKMLGLDDYIAVFQARYDRYMEASK